VAALEAEPKGQGESVLAASAPATESAVEVEVAETAVPSVNILADDYLSHITLLAHDELKGRGTGHYGIDLAAGYIAGQFAAFGLEPGGPDGTYFQEFTIASAPRLLDDTSLTFTGVDRDLKLRADFIPFGFSSDGAFSGEVVFVGYGIENPDEDYDDYARIDVEGKVGLMLRREPPSWDGDKWTSHARFTSKMELAVEHGFAAVIIVNQNPGPEEDDILMPYGMRVSRENGIPAIHLKRDVADAVLAASGAESLTGLQEKLDVGMTSSTALSGIWVTGNVVSKSDNILARNVIGVLPGVGPCSDEYVVFGAHYDHLGETRGRIYNGADDNASGTAGVIEIARVLSVTPYRNRSVICMTFSGEEMGLHGSRHYANDPTVDIDKIAAMLNLDMIGRLSDKRANMLAIQGLGTGDSFHDIVDRHTSAIGVEYLPDESATGGSDHMSFYLAGVPSLFFFTGTHPDYHQPGDDTEKINADGGAMITTLACNIGLDLINAASRPVYAEVKGRAAIHRSPRPVSGVVMGFMPDMEDESDQKGWHVAAFSPGSPAAEAGMKVADRIFEIEGKPINGFEDYQEVMAGRKAGETVTVKVLRGSDEVTLEVTLAPRK